MSFMCFTDLKNLKCLKPVLLSRRTLRNLHFSFKHFNQCSFYSGTLCTYLLNQHISYMYVLCFVFDTWKYIFCDVSNLEFRRQNINLFSKIYRDMLIKNE